MGGVRTFLHYDAKHNPTELGKEQTKLYDTRTKSSPKLVCWCLPFLIHFLLLADFFFLTDLVVGLTAAFFVPNTVSQFFENSGVGAVRTMGPDIVD